MKEDNTSGHSERDFNLNLLCELHIGLKRQGPGSPKATLTALGFLPDLGTHARVADLGCGTGGQTMILAQNIAGTIAGVDFFPEFIRAFNDSAKALNLGRRVKGVVGSMDDLSFKKEEFDLIWSEGAIAGIGFEKGLRYWRDFLKKDGYVAVTYESWFTDERPAEIETWWTDAVPEMNTIPHNVAVIQKAGYRLIAAFALPEECWTENYLVPRAAAEDALLKKYAGNEAAEAFVATMRRERELYSKYKQYYGYVFYIAQKI